MVSLSKQAQQWLTLWHRHCQQQQAFYAAEIENRRVLDQRHRQERNSLLLRKSGPYALALLLRRHVSEIMELRVINQEKWLRLKNDQEQEKANLEATLKLAGQEVTSQKNHIT